MLQPIWLALANQCDLFYNRVVYFTLNIYLRVSPAEQWLTSPFNDISLLNGPTVVLNWPFDPLLERVFWTEELKKKKFDVFFLSLDPHQCDQIGLLLK